MRARKPHWTAKPTILTVLKRLEGLSARLARLEALQQVQRTTAIVRALQETKVKP